MAEPFTPMKAVLSDKPFDDPNWIFERKLDGIRCGVVRRGGRVELISRGGEVLNDAYPELEEALAVDGPDLVADGEIVAFDRGQTSFARLQGRMQIRDRARARASGIAVFYYLFDLLSLDGEDLVIGGWTEPKGSRHRLGAILVGHYDGRGLRYAGKVGTGFDEATLQRLGDQLERRERPTSPFVDDGLPRARWAEPELVAQIAFTEWTRDGRLRHPRYEGLRDDKPAREVVREEPAA